MHVCVCVRLRVCLSRIQKCASPATMMVLHTRTLMFHLSARVQRAATLIQLNRSIGAENLPTLASLSYPNIFHSIQSAAGSGDCTDE